MAAPRFREVEFLNTPRLSAADKARFANRLAEFISGGLQPRKLHNALYRDLAHCFGLEAQADCTAFVSAYFATPEARMRFLQRVLAEPHGDGHPSRDLSDVEAVIARWLRHDSDVREQLPAMILGSAA